MGFSAIRLRFDLDTDADDEAVEKLVELTERYCVVLQTIGPQRRSRACVTWCPDPPPPHVQAPVASDVGPVSAFT